MIHEYIKLKDYIPAIKSEASLTTFCPDNFEEYSIGKIRKCLLVIPGGGYQFVSEREAEAIAVKFLSEDFAVFVLKYTVDGFEYPTPINEALASVKYIRDNCEKYHVDPNYISLLGFSAGGHLAASSTLLCTDKYFADLLDCSNDDLKVNGLLLAYPVITMGKYTHEGTRDQICNGDEKLVDKLSVEKHITSDFPPTFIWLTAEDVLVPPYNSLELAQQLVNNNVTVELHMYPKGHHGLATCDTMTNEKDFSDVKNWIGQAIYFLKNRV